MPAGILPQASPATQLIFGPEPPALGERSDLRGGFAGCPCFGGVHAAVPGLVGRALGVGGEHEESAAGGALLVDLSDPLALLLELPGPGREVDLLALLGARGARHPA